LERGNPKHGQATKEGKRRPLGPCIGGLKKSRAHAENRHRFEHFRESILTMHVQPTRLVPLLVCLAFGFGLLGVAAPAEAAKKKSSASKKHHKAHHKSSSPAKAEGAKGGAAAPAEEADEDDDDQSAESEKSDDTKAKPAKTAKAAKSDDDEKEASDDKSGGGGDDDGDGDTVVRRKAKKPAIEEEGPSLVAFELSAGPRVVHRTFDFNDPLSAHDPSAVKPYSYVLPGGPTPFVTLALYPAAFATHGGAANVGLVASYERLVGTKTTGANGSSFSTLGQQLEVGLRARLPVAEHELGLTASYGKQTFQVNATDPGPAMGSTVPNVDYTFAAVGADARLRLSPVEIGAHVGTRFVFKTGSLAQNWFNTTKTTSIEGGLSVAYRVTPIFAVVVGGDVVRYGFNFNPVPTNSFFVAGGAVDQYLSGYLALRVSLSGG
jgi:hypothetical protein